MSESARFYKDQPPMNDILVAPPSPALEPAAPEPGLDPHKALCDQVRTIMQDENITFAQLAVQSDIKRGTVSSFIGGTYSGKPEPVVKKLQNWLKTREEAQRMAAKAIKKPPFTEMPTAQRFLGALTFAQSMSEIVVVATEPGLGKSAALRHYQKNRVPRQHLWFQS